MPDQVAQVGHRLDLVGPAVIRDRERQVQLAQGGLGLDLDQHGQGAGREQGCRIVLALELCVRYRTEQGYHQRFQLIERLGAKHYQPHDIGRVMCLVEADEFIPDSGIGAVSQRFQRADRKLAVRVRGVHHRLQHIEAAARITLETHLEFSLHCILFTVHIGRVKPRGDEKLGETVKRLRQIGGIHVEKIIGVFKAGVGVAGAAMLGDVLLVLRRVGVFVSAQKQHVLQKVREATAALGIVTAAHADIQRRRRLDRLRVGDQQYLHLVGQRQQPVLVVIIGALYRLLAGVVQRGASG